MVYEGLHILINIPLLRWDYLRHIDIKGAVGEILQGLFDYPRRLPHLLHTHPVTVKAVPPLTRRDIEVQPVVDEVRLVFPDIPLDPTPPEGGPTQTKVYGLLRRYDANPLVPRKPYPVLIEELLIVGNPTGQEIDKVVTLILEARLEVETNSPYPHIVRGHPCPTQHFEEVEDHLSLPERIEEDGHGSQIEGPRADSDEVTADPGELRGYNTDILRPLRQHDLHEFLHRLHVGEVIGHPRHIVKPVRIGDELGIEEVFGYLFRPPVEVTDIGLRLDDLLTLHIKEEV